MRIYLLSAPDRYAACAPDIPGSGITGHEERPTRETALERCRAFVAQEIAAYERLGVPLHVTPDEQIVEWDGPWWSIPEWLIPPRPAHLRAGIQRMDEIADELERGVARLPAEAWDRRDGSDWSPRLTLDHIASGFTVGLLYLEPFPLDPLEAQMAALRELLEVLRASLGSRQAFRQFGLNAENARVRWTPRKVARCVSAMQAAAGAFQAGKAERPTPPFDHGDRPDDDEPLTEADLEPLADADAAIRAHETPVPIVAFWYRYYRYRLLAWPDDERMRWRATYAAFRARVASADDADVARVRLVPMGNVVTIRSELRLGIAHVLGHLEQIRTSANAFSGSRRPPPR